MKYIYEEISNVLDEKLIKRTDEIGNVSWIPKDESNSDYQAYLAELEAAQDQTATI